MKTMDPDTILLRKYKKPVIDALRKIKEDRLGRSLCRDKLKPLSPARLTEIRKGHRELSPYYLGKFLQGEVVTLEQILQGRKLADLPKEDQILLKKLSMPDKMVEIINELEGKGVDVLAQLQNISNLMK